MNTNLDIELMRRKLAAHRGSYPSVARETGLSLSWVREFARGGNSSIRNPTMRSIEQLQRYLDAHTSEERTA